MFGYIDDTRVCLCLLASFRLVTKMPSKSLLTTSSLLHPPLEMEADHLMCPTAVATSTTTTITTTILSITPATSIESTLSRVQDGQLSSRNQPSQMSKAHQFSTAAAVQGQQPKIFMVKNNHPHQISTPPPQIKEPDTNSSSHEYESTKPISQKTDFHSNQLRSDSNSTIYTKTTSTLSDSDSKKDFKDEPSKFDPPATNDAPASYQTAVSKNTQMFHQRQFPLGIPIADTMVCPFVVTIANPNSTSTKNGLSPVARISSSSSKVSDV